MSVNTNTSLTTATPSSASPSTEEWIAQFHALYNPIHTTTTRMSDMSSQCLTSTPVRHSTNHSRVSLHDLSGIEIYEDLEEMEETCVETSDDCYEIEM